MPGSDRLHGTKRKAESLYHQQLQVAIGEGQPLQHAGSGRHLTKTTSSSSTSKHKRNKSKHEAETGALCAVSARPAAGAIKPLVEYDDISSDSDTFLDSPATENPVDSRDVEQLDLSDYGEAVAGVAKENRTHKRKRSRKKSKDRHRVRESAERSEGAKKSIKDRERANKESRRKVKERASPVACLASSSRRSGEAGAKKPGGCDSVYSGAVQSAVNLGSSASSASSSISKESVRSSKSRKDKRRNEEYEEDRSHRKAAKSHKSSPKGKSQSRRSGADSPSAAELENSYSSKRKAASPSPYREPPRRSRQRSESPYGRRRSSSPEKDGSPYVSRSPYASRRSPSSSPVSR